MDTCNCANGGVQCNNDEYLVDVVNPVSRLNPSFIIFNNIKYYQTPYEQYYVSEDGVLLSLKQHKYYFPKMYQRGNYLRCAIYFGACRKKHISIHKIMMETFYSEKPEGYAIDHIDGNPFNNKISNLRYLTWRDNVRRACCGKLGNTAIAVIVNCDGIISKFLTIQQFRDYFGFSYKAWKLLKKNSDNCLFDEVLTKNLKVKTFKKDDNGYYLELETIRD